MPKCTSSSSRLILAAPGGTAAALLTNSGNTSFGSGSVSDPLWIAKSKYKGKTMGYDYFAAHMGVVKGQSSDWLSENMDTPVYNAEKEFWYINPASGTATIATPWAVAWLFQGQENLNANSAKRRKTRILYLFSVFIRKSPNIFLPRSTQRRPL